MSKVSIAPKNTMPNQPNSAPNMVYNETSEQALTHTCRTDMTERARPVSEVSQKTSFAVREKFPDFENPCMFINFNR